MLLHGLVSSTASSSSIDFFYTILLESPLSITVISIYIYIYICFCPVYSLSSRLYLWWTKQYKHFTVQHSTRICFVLFFWHNGRKSAFDKSITKCSLSNDQSSINFFLTKCQQKVKIISFRICCKAFAFSCIIFYSCSYCCVHTLYNCTDDQPQSSQMDW